jgi:hypothetical protein
VIDLVHKRLALHAEQQQREKRGEEDSGHRRQGD